MRLNDPLKISGFFAVFCTLSISYAFASVNLSISPIEGGSVLEFNRFDVLSQSGREVRVRLTSTEDGQYQVFQRWIQPLTSGTGGLPGRDAVKFYALPGSNGSGTLYGNVPEYIGMSDQLIYTSSPDGISDNFILAYQVDPQRLEVGGQLNGRLLFTVRSMGASGTQDVFLDVFIDADLGFEASVEREKGGQTIRLGTRVNGDGNRDDVNMYFKGNVGQVRVYQEVLNPLVSVIDQSEFPIGVLQYVTVGHTDGIQGVGLKDLDPYPALIYDSSYMEDQWSLAYQLRDERLSALKAGMYHGKIRYTIESGMIREDIDFDIEVEIEPVFEITFDFPEGPVDFSRVIPESAPQEHVVDVSINSNLGVPYAVSKKVSDLLRNEKGDAFDGRNFMFRIAADPGIKGNLKFPEYVPAEGAREQTIFISDRQGSPAHFKVFYRLVPYRDMSPGNYRTEITYSLGQI